MRSRRPIIATDINYWKYLYEGGLACPKIAELVDRDPGVIWRVLTRERVQLRDNRKYTVDEYFFDLPLHLESQRYWLGFVIADGIIRPNMLVIKLGHKDRLHLVKFKKDIQSSHPIKDAEETRGSKTYYSSTISIGSVYLTSSLSQYGVIQNKMYRSYVPRGLENDIPFWRGVFDGDGGFSLRDRKDGSRATLTGSEKIIASFRDFIFKHTNSYPKIRQVKQTFSVEFGGNGLCRDIAHLLYDDASVFLERKMKLAQQLFSLEVRKRNVRKGNTRSS